MNRPHPGICWTPATLSAGHLRAMIRLARALHRLAGHGGYQALVHATAPPVVAHEPGNHGVPMGYDFHLTPAGPRLIEVNTNAGGLLLAWLAQQGDPATDWQAPPSPAVIHAWSHGSLARAFRQEAATANRAVKRAVILDDNPAGQFLQPEMAAYAALFQAMGWQAALAAPETLTMSRQGVLLAGERVDLIYNRHCDFYLDQPALAGLREAWLAGQVCLTPHPRVYGLLADKRRMILWRDVAALTAAGVDPGTVALLQEQVPATLLLADTNREEIWRGRKGWVFKPVTAFGSRGVVPGDGISRVRFESLDPRTTLVQALIPPSQVGQGQEAMKCDWRLFTHGETILMVAARLYRGQVTNLRTPGNGFAPVRVVA